MIGETVAESVRSTAVEIDRFFAATGGIPPDNGASAMIGDLRTQLDVTSRQIPIKIMMGVLPRTEISLAMPIVREQVLVQNFVAPNGTLGRNPNAAANAALLASVDPRWEALGRSVLLPTEASPLGVQLRQRVMAVTGRALALPTAAVDAEGIGELLAAFPQPIPTRSGLQPWRVGDLEIGVRVLAISTLGASPYPTGDGEMDLRLTASAAARLPTGQQPALADRFTQLPSTGRSGFRVGTEGDLFAGRLWLNGTASLLTLRSRSENVGETDLPTAVLWDPATELLMTLAPRYRVAETIAMGARYELARSGGTRREAILGETGFVLESPSGSIQRVGFDLRFTTLPTLTRLPTTLRGPLALEAGIMYLQDISGPAGVPAARSVVLQGSLVHRLWGGRAEPAAPRN